MSKKEYWHNKRGLKQVSGFLKPNRKRLLKQVMLEQTDLTSLTRYITLLLERHLKEYVKAKSVAPPPQPDSEFKKQGDF